MTDASRPTLAHARGPVRTFAVLAVMPFVLAVVAAWLDDVGILVSLFGAALFLMALALVTIVSVVRGAMTPRLPGRGSEYAAAIATPLLLSALSLAVALPLFRVGGIAGVSSRLIVQRGHYERIIAKTRGSREPLWYVQDGRVRYSTDLGPPLRVAFNPNGILDNWSAIVYDPSGEVMLADGFTATASSGLRIA